MASDTRWRNFQVGLRHFGGSLACPNDHYVLRADDKALGIWNLTHLPPVGDSPQGAERKMPDNADAFWRHNHVQR